MSEGGSDQRRHVIGKAGCDHGEGTRAARTSLPKTASDVPIVGMVGVLAILGAVSVYFWRNRTTQAR